MLDQLVEFAADAVERAADEAGSKVVVAGNSLGGWTALRLAERKDLPIAGVVPIGPAGIRMAPAFFTLDRIPGRIARHRPAGAAAAGGRALGRRQPLPPPRLCRPARGVDQAVVDRFTRFHIERSVIRDRIEYAKRLRNELGDPFDAEAIDVPVTVIWGESDRLCMPAGADELAKLLPHAKVTDAARRRPHAAGGGPRRGGAGDRGAVLSVGGRVLIGVRGTAERGQAH